jgi:4-amino-4-deoxy-L-arabinose transferase-like glycosyltransferase
MTHDDGLPPRGAAILLALTAALLLLRLGQVPLLGPDEPRYARVAVEMQRAGEWVRPTLQGEPWLEKPPLYYWLAGAAFRVLGENETAARLPSVAAALWTVGVTALVGARLFGGAVGLHAGFVLGLSLLPFAYGRAATMDMLLAATVTTAVGLLALRLLGVAGRFAIPVAGAFAGLATLAKGPLGLLLPGLVVAGFVLVTRRWRLLRECLSPTAALLFTVVAAPWYVAIWRDQGQRFVDVFLLNHNLQRFTSTIHSHPGAPWYYLPVLLGGLLPWTGLVFPALAQARHERSAAETWLLLWLLAPLLFFSLAGSKLPGYVLPCLPPLAILTGRTCRDLAMGQAGRTWPRIAALVGLVLGALVFALPLRQMAVGQGDFVLAVPAGLWALVVAFVFSRRLAMDPAGALRVLRIGAAGFLLLLTGALPTLLARRESGRDLFIPAAGREVLAWNAWRTAWMSGYFYNDGKVREVDGLPAIAAAAAPGPVLVLCGPGERRALESAPGLVTRLLAEGPRENVLLGVRTR